MKDPIYEPNTTDSVNNFQYSGKSIVMIFKCSKRISLCNSVQSFSFRDRSTSR